MKISALVLQETGWVNEEEIQKGIYLLQEEGFPFGYTFVNRKTGKYSIQLSEDIDEMMRNGLCDTEEYSLKNKYAEVLKHV